MNLQELFKVEGKIAVVTGGSRGIGEMIAAGFLANGVKVYITARKFDALKTKAKELSKHYDQECIPIAADLSTKEGVDKFCDEIKQHETPVSNTHLTLPTTPYV